MGRPTPKLNIRVVIKEHGSETYRSLEAAYYDGSKSVADVAARIASFATFDGATVRIQSMARGGVTQYAIKNGNAVKEADAL